MALNITELRNDIYYKEGSNIWMVLTYEHVKMGRGNGTVKLRVKNIRTGSVVDRTYMTGARVDEANVSKVKAQFLYCDRKGTIEASMQSGGDSYRDGDNYAFMNPSSYEQFSISSQILGEQAKFLKDGAEITLIVWEGEPLGMELPASLTYQVSETGPGEKGNSVSNVFKEAVLENGLTVKVPMFIGIGEKIKVDTRNGEYIERVK